MPYEQIITETRGRVCIVTLNRPERLNAQSVTMNKEMRAAIDACNNDPGIGAVVLTGAGRAFCAGADIGGWKSGIEARERGEETGRPELEVENWVYFVIRSKPIVVAINGPAIGAGLTITLPCDVRIASDQARLAMRFVRVGFIPELASTRILTYIVGMGQALELMLSGRIIDAQEAGRIGLVNRVVPHDRLLDAAVETAAEIAFNPTECVQVTKGLAWSSLAEPDLMTIMKRERAEYAAAMGRPSFKEAVNAFLEKRQPDFHRS
jgi:enoyl-CoA hydratase/carnithine racemase